jgi:hypothetical protein
MYGKNEELRLYCGGLLPSCLTFFPPPFFPPTFDNASLKSKSSLAAATAFSHDPKCRSPAQRSLLSFSIIYLADVDD